MGRNLKIIIALVMMLGAASVFLYRENSEEMNDVQTSSVESVDAMKFNELMNQENVFLIDVHTPEQTHIPGTDAFIPYNEIEQFTDQLPTDTSTPILVYCRSGSMSREASETLSSLGYSTVYDLAGGIDAFAQQVEMIAMTPEARDLGTVIYGNVARTDFTLTNFTPDPIVITNVSTTCGCTKAAVTKTSLAPYERTQITVTFDPAVHKDDTDIGNVTRTIYIETDHSSFQKISADITAMVIHN